LKVVKSDCFRPLLYASFKILSNYRAETIYFVARFFHINYPDVLA